MVDEYGTGELFDLPEKYRPARRVDDGDDIRWRTYKGKRTSCDECIVDIAKGELRWAARQATHVRTHKGVASFLCTRHTYDAKLRDGL
jgi:hypothetical protein